MLQRMLGWSLCAVRDLPSHAGTEHAKTYSFGSNLFRRRTGIPLTLSICLCKDWLSVYTQKHHRPVFL